MAVVALVIAIVSLAVAGGSVWYTRAQALAAREAVKDEQRRDQEAQRDRADRLRMDIREAPTIHVADRPMGKSAPSLVIKNDSGVSMTAIDVSYEALQPNTPHEHIEHIAFMTDGDQQTVHLPRAPSRLMATWRDPDGVLWIRRHIGVDHILERLEG